MFKLKLRKPKSPDSGSKFSIPRMKMASVQPKSLQPKMASLQPKFASLQPKLASLQPKLASLQPKLTSLQPKLASLQPRLASLQSKFASLQPKLAPLRQWVTPVTAEISFRLSESGGRLYDEQFGLIESWRNRSPPRLHDGVAILHVERGEWGIRGSRTPSVVPHTGEALKARDNA